MRCDSLALAGTESTRSGGRNIAALCLCLERLAPPLKRSDTKTTLPRLTGALVKQGQAVLDALSARKVMADSASTVMWATASQAKAAEIAEFESGGGS